MNRLPTPYDARTAYLFQCGNEELFAVSPDKARDAIPMSSCAQGWLFRQDFPSGVQEPSESAEHWGLVRVGGVGIVPQEMTDEPP
jgi:hypothetical protein